MEPLILIIALVLVAALTVVKNFRYAPSHLSDFELARRAERGDKPAIYEARRRPLLPTLIGLKVFKLVILTSLLAVMLVVAYGWWVGFLLLVGFWLASELVAAKEWLIKPARNIQKKGEPLFMNTASSVAKVFRHFAPCPGDMHGFVVGSREELFDIIEHDKYLLTTFERARVLSALDFSKLKISDAMVPRDDIAAVDANETVGPVLLDRLHKAKRDIFVVTNGSDADRIKGLLYMTDATSGHPGIHTVRDALRPTVYYLSQYSLLDTVFTASLQTGRQLFIVVDNQGNTSGLITLRDALAKLLGSAPPTHMNIATDPKKVNE